MNGLARDTHVQTKRMTQRERVPRCKYGNSTQQTHQSGERKCTQRSSHSERKRTHTPQQSGQHNTRRPARTSMCPTKPKLRVGSMPNVTGTKFVLRRGVIHSIGARRVEGSAHATESSPSARRTGRRTPEQQRTAANHARAHATHAGTRGAQQWASSCASKQSRSQQERHTDQHTAHAREAGARDPSAQRTRTRLTSR